MESVKIASFYCFTRLDSIINKQSTLQSLCHHCSVKGLIILAEEGVNGTIAGKKEKVDLVYGQRRPKKSKEIATSINTYLNLKKAGVC